MLFLLITKTDLPRLTDIVRRSNRKNTVNMKKKAVLVAYVALLATPAAVMAQYPQLTDRRGKGQV